MRDQLDKYTFPHYRQNRVANSFKFSIGRNAAVNHFVYVPNPAICPYDRQRNDIAVLHPLTIHLNINPFQLTALPALSISIPFDEQSIANICSRFKNDSTIKKDLPRYLGRSNIIRNKLLIRES